MRPVLWAGLLLLAVLCDALQVALGTRRKAAAVKAPSIATRKSSALQGASSTLEVQLDSYLSESCSPVPTFSLLVERWKEIDNAQLRFEIDDQYLSMHVTTNEYPPITAEGSRRISKLTYDRNLTRPANMLTHYLRLTFLVPTDEDQRVELYFDPDEEDVLYVIGALICLAEKQAPATILDGAPISPPVFDRKGFINGIVQVINLRDSATDDTRLTVPILEDDISNVWFEWGLPRPAYVRDSRNGTATFWLSGPASSVKEWSELLQSKRDALARNTAVRYISGGKLTTSWLHEPGTPVLDVSTPLVESQKRRSVLWVLIVVCVVLLGLSLFLCLVRLPWCAPCRRRVANKVPVCIVLYPEDEIKAIHRSRTPARPPPPPPSPSPAMKAPPQTPPPSQSSRASLGATSNNPIDAHLPAVRSLASHYTAASAQAMFGFARGAHASRADQYAMEEDCATEEDWISLGQRDSSPRAQGPVLARLRGVGFVGPPSGGGEGVEFVPGPGWENTTDATEMSQRGRGEGSLYRCDAAIDIGTDYEQ